MFYLLYLYYADIAQEYPLLHLIQYQTVRVALAMATAMIVAVAMGIGGIQYYILPCIANSFGGIATQARQARSSMLEVIR